MQAALGLGKQIAFQRTLHRAVQVHIDLIRRKCQDELILLNFFIDQVHGRDGVEDARSDPYEPDQWQSISQSDSKSFVFGAAPLIPSELVPVQAIGSFSVVVCRDPRLGV